MNWLTLKLLQYIAGALLIACIGLGAKGCALVAERDTARLEAELADVEREAVGAEREAWKSKAADAIAANKAYDVIFDQQREAAEQQQRLAEETARKAAAAVAAAKRDEVRAEQDLAAFKRRFANKPADCTAALARLDAVCKIGSY